jgi:hypothetical protein
MYTREVRSEGWARSVALRGSFWTRGPLFPGFEGRLSKEMLKVSVRSRKVYENKENLDIMSDN